MSVRINHISVYLPQKRLSNAELATDFNISDEQVFKNTHINTRYISAPDELSSDMARDAG